MNKGMKYYAAPLEGITGYIYRRAHHRYFGGVDKYFTPFLTPKPKKGWTSKEKNDILPAHNKGIPVVPQILTNQPEDFIMLASELHELGYEEVNLNLGCPSPTVVTKGKGSGFLAEPDQLKYFFDRIFQKVKVKVSVKSRLGMASPDEICGLAEIYNQFPLHEVILHARVGKDMYKKSVNLEGFYQAFLLCRRPLCYNGDIFTKEDFYSFAERYPEVDRVMVGRGMIADPQVFEEIRFDQPRDIKRWRAFHEEVCAGYEEIMSGERNILFKMKELWSYMAVMFPEGQRYLKKIKKTTKLSEYKRITEELFSSGLL